jgi:hypothetical protein
MKTLFCLSLFCICFGAAQAQDTTLKAYVGTYTFPEGSFVPSAEVSLKDTVLNINSIQGSSDLMKRGRDTFALLSYDGTAFFKRDSTGKITGIKVAVEDILIEGPKDVATTEAKQKQPANRPKKTAAE